MARFGFVGPSYTLSSINADCQMAMNFYVENNEDPNSNSARTLLGTPGLSVFCDTGDTSVPQLYEINGRAFAITNQSLYELFADGTKIQRGKFPSRTTPAYAASSPEQMLISAGTRLYVLDLGTNKFSNLDDPTQCGAVSFSDGYFLVQILNTQDFRVSALFDATSWDPADVARVSVFPDNLVASLMDHRELWLWGQKKTVVYGDSGNPDFPWDVVPGAFIEQGCAAAASPVRLDNSVFWLGRDERGAGIVWRAQGYLPQRVSSHAVETAFSQFSRLDDAVGYVYQDGGHSFYVLYFPTANQTWVYDVATGLWHQRGFWNNNNASFDAHRSQCHCYAFGKHLVGDWATGNVYQMSLPVANGAAWSFCDDFGNPLRRVRRAPHLSEEQQWMSFSQLQVYAEAGLGPQLPLTDANGDPRDPEMMLRWSNDAGHSWSNEIKAPCGQSGQFGKRIIWRRLGRARDRVFEIAVTDPIPWRIVDAYLMASPGYGVTERISSNFKKGA